VLAHRVDLLDGGAALQELSGHRLEIGHRDVRGGQRKQARAAARQQGEQQVVRPEPFHLGQDRARRGFAGLVRHRMASLDHADALRRHAVPVARDRDAAQLALPVLLDRGGHRSGRLAGGGDVRPSLRSLGQVRSEDAARIGRGDCGAEAFLEQRAHLG
jgi:hypothetical protein